MCSLYPGIVCNIKLFFLVFFLLSLATCTAYCQTLLEVTRMMQMKHEHCESPRYTTLVIPILLHHIYIYIYTHTHKCIILQLSVITSCRLPCTY